MLLGLAGGLVVRGDMAVLTNSPAPNGHCSGAAATKANSRRWLLPAASWSFRPLYTHSVSDHVGGFGFCGWSIALLPGLNHCKSGTDVCV